jgi:hypothetical protein
LLFTCAASAQEAQPAAPAEPAAPAAESESSDIVYLSPFEVTSEGSIGYQARDTLAGTRLRTDLKDVANAVQVINSQFMKDTGVINTKSLLVYTTNTEVGGVGGNFANVGTGVFPKDANNRVSPQKDTRVRGLNSADNTRNFFLTRLPWDGYNVDRVDIQRGANSMLFGIGSPSGIINTNMQGASFFNEGKVEARVGSYGSIRGLVNVNRMLLDDELAIRVAGLYNDEEYQQRPAFSKDKRIYGAFRYDPKWAKIGSSKLSIKGNFEHGNIVANRPRATPPVDKITAWMNYSKAEGSAYTINNCQGILGMTQANAASRGYDGDNHSVGCYYSTSSVSSPGWTVEKNYNPYIVYWSTPDVTGSPEAMFDKDGFIGVTGSDCATYDPDDNTKAGYAYNSSGTTQDGSADSNSDTMAYRFGYGFGGYADYSKQAYNYATGGKGMDGSKIGAWKNYMLTDTSIFDYRNKLLDGDTKREKESWDSFNVTATETFFDDMVGVEVAYDHQQDLQTYRSVIGEGNAYAIDVDVCEYYNGVSVRDDSTTSGYEGSSYKGVTKIGSDGMPYSTGGTNPYVGYAYVASRGTCWSDKETRNTYRGTIFVDLDFKKFLDPDSTVTKVIGRHVFQVNATRMTVTNQHRGWYDMKCLDRTVGSSSSGYDTNMAVRYYLKDLTSYYDTNSSNYGKSLNIPNVKGTMTDLTAPSKVTEKVFIAQSNSTSSVSYGVASNNAGEDGLYKTTECYDQRVITDSFGAIWNGYLLDNCVVPTVGYRSDRQEYFSSGTPSTKDGTEEEADLNDDEWYLPTSKSDCKTSSSDQTHGHRTYNKTTGNSTSWGVVVHTPDFINKHLPAGMEFSLFFNKSDNFRPDASRLTLEGAPCDSEEGDTKDYGFSISALDNRINLKVNWYKTTVKNASLTQGSDALAGGYYLGDGELWAYRRALMYEFKSNNYNGGYGYNEPGWNTGAAIDLGSWYDTTFGTQSYSDTYYGKERSGSDYWSPLHCSTSWSMSEDDIKAGYYYWRQYEASIFDSANQPDALFDKLAGGSSDYSFERAWMGGKTMEEWYAACQAISTDDLDHSTAINNLVTSIGKSGDKGYYDILGDTESKGVEFELTAQLTPNWNVMVNVSKTEAVRQKMASTYVAFTEDRFAMYKTYYGKGQLWWDAPCGYSYDSTTKTYSYVDTNGDWMCTSWMSTYYGDYLYSRAMEGRSVPELCKWRANIVTNYSFTEGFLKGVNVGCGYRWQQRHVIGYALKTDDDGNVLAFNSEGKSIEANLIYTDTTGKYYDYCEEYDLSKAYWGKDQGNFDAWIGYERKLTDDVTWKIQLNARNIFASDELIPLAAQPDGSIATYRIPEATTWYITNTITF